MRNPTPSFGCNKVPVQIRPTWLKPPGRDFDPRFCLAVQRSLDRDLTVALSLILRYLGTLIVSARQARQHSDDDL